MSPHDLEQVYAALSEALGRVGEGRAALLLSTLALDLLSSGIDAEVASTAIERAERLCRR